MNDETGGIMCIKEVIYGKHHNVSVWVVALDMYIYQCIKGWF